jgi:dTDP-4-amino-4,6-dideoxygalactose transaminase
MNLMVEKIGQMQISFSPPYIDEDVIAEVVEVLSSGWITTGPKVKELELLCASFTGAHKAICVNSWTSGAALVLRWLGIGPGDEVIIPAYTYAATALCILNAGAKPVMVDVLEDFTIDPNAIAKAITPATKAVICVDFGGLPCNYNEIKAVVTTNKVKKQFVPANDIQAKFGYPVIISDAAHSMGALYNGISATLAPDIAILSLHAVKNITTAEGGVICLHLPLPFDNDEVYSWMKLNSMNGQTKDAFAKKDHGAWRYDIVSQGMKVNMPDVCAAIGLAQLRKYASQLLPDRKRVYDQYCALLEGKSWAMLPFGNSGIKTTSYHLFPLRIKGITEEQRDKIIQAVSEAGVATNVHFIPLPMLTFFRNMGYNIEDYPVALHIYTNEISLPIYPQLTEEQVKYIVEKIDLAYNEVTA